MDTQAMSQELLGLEQRFWQAMQDGDTKTAESLTDESCTVAGPQGVMRLTRSDLGMMLGKMPYAIKGFAIEDARVDALDDRSAVVAYTVKEDLMVDGKPVSLEASDTSLWLLKDGKWVCALHTESLKGDPFGRDKEAPTASSV